MPARPKLLKPDTPGSRRAWLGATLMLLIAASAALRLAGQVWWCALGDLNPVVLDAWSPHTSQHLLDPYSLSHLLHGLIFFGFFWYFRDRWALWQRFFFAALVEVAWELFENSPIVINRYRTATAALGYAGDSVVNSLGDDLCCLLGFLLASRLGLWKSVVLYFAVELLLLAWIRDNLTLNVLMLVYPIEAIKHWQAGG